MGEWDRGVGVEGWEGMCGVMEERMKVHVQVRIFAQVGGRSGGYY